MTSSNSYRFDLTPVPASRPRVTRWGVYYGKTYTQYRKDAQTAIVQPEAKLEGPLEVSIMFLCKKPKTTKRLWPRGDLDNYEKAILDALTDKGYWDDDDQIVSLSSTKIFSDDPHTHVSIREVQL